MRSIIYLCNHPGNDDKRNCQRNQDIPAVLNLLQKTKALFAHKENYSQNYNPFVHIDHLYVCFIGDYCIGTWRKFTVNQYAYKCEKGHKPGRK